MDTESYLFDFRGIPAVRNLAASPGYQATAKITTAFSRWILRPALVLGFALTGNAFAEAAQFSVPFEEQTNDTWICQTEVDAQHTWYMRCRNLTDALADDPVLSTIETPPAAKMIPLYGAPYADSNLDHLASAVLCETASSCQIVIASR